MSQDTLSSEDFVSFILGLHPLEPLMHLMIVRDFFPRSKRKQQLKWLIMTFMVLLISQLDLHFHLYSQAMRLAELKITELIQYFS